MMLINRIKWALENNTMRCDHNERRRLSDVFPHGVSLAIGDENY